MRESQLGRMPDAGLDRLEEGDDIQIRSSKTCFRLVRTSCRHCNIIQIAKELRLTPLLIFSTMLRTFRPARQAGLPEAEDSRDAVRLLADVVSLLEPRLLELWTTTGITFGQRRLLGQLRRGPQSAGALAAALGISAPSLTRRLQTLEDNGFISRSIDRDDRRRVLVSLASKGQASLAGRKVFEGSPLALAAADLTDRQRRDLVRALRLLIQRARERAAGDDDD